MPSENADEAAPLQNGLTSGRQNRQDKSPVQTDRPPVQAFDPYFPAPRADAPSAAEPRAYSPFRIYEPRETGY
jgi:hypothetical protein